MVIPIVGMRWSGRGPLEFGARVVVVVNEVGGEGVGLRVRRYVVV